jgi:hypothetical protein
MLSEKKTPIPETYTLDQVKAILMYGRLEGAPALAEEVIQTMIEHDKLPKRVT